MLSLRGLETLRAVARTGSLVSAAQQLHMTPAALTARIRKLEEAFGVSLFDRTTSGLKPNTTGLIALEGANRVDRAVRDLEQAMEFARHGEEGKLEVSVVSTAKYFAPQLIARFLDTRPRVELRLQIGNRAETIESIRSFGAEVVLAGRPPAELPIAQWPIGPHPYVLIAPPGHRLEGRRGITPAELAGERLLVREEGSGTRSLFDYLIGGIGLAKRTAGIELGSNETIKQAVMAGLGVALISAHTIAVEVADGRLVCLDMEGLPIVRQWFVLTRTDRSLSPVGAAFREFAMAEAGKFLPVLPSAAPERSG
jgi:DNA-binding transcriptional LysR family regulator